VNAAVQGGGASEGLVANFVEGIGAIGDEFTKEDLVGIRH
jgi:hypothetical protein